MITIRRHKDIHNAKHGGWLDSRFHFSFSDYSDPQHNNWGTLRVLNDDHIGPGGAFDLHPHAGYEIVTVMLSGSLEHEDDMGNRGVLGSGEVQAMSAGSGVFHAERNAGAGALHLLQIWVGPSTRSKPPAWKQARFEAREWEGKLLPLVVGEGSREGELAGARTPLSIRERAVFYRCALDGRKGQALERQVPGKAYLYVIDGALELSGHTLHAGDGAKIEGERLAFSPRERAEFLLIERL